MKRLFIFAFSFFIGTTAAQVLIFNKPLALTQLPSSECYNIIQDKEGYIWFSTEGGLCKYNGKEIELFDEKRGLKEKAVYGSFIGPDGKPWFLTSPYRDWETR